MTKARDIADSELGSLTVDTDTLVVDETNNRVGIGTSSPATALDVNGTVTADDLTVDGDVEINDISPSIYFGESDLTDVNTRIWSNGGKFEVQTRDDGNTGIAKTRISVDNAAGDISFYEDTGTTPKFFWDASAESLLLDGTLDFQKQSTPKVYIQTESRIKFSTGNVFNITASSAQDTCGLRLVCLGTNDGIGATSRYFTEFLISRALSGSSWGVDAIADSGAVYFDVVLSNLAEDSLTVTINSNHSGGSSRDTFTFIESYGMSGIVIT